MSLRENNTITECGERASKAVARIKAAGWGFEEVAAYTGRDRTITRRWFAQDQMRGPTLETVLLLETVAGDLERLHTFQNAFGRVLVSADVAAQKWTDAESRRLEHQMAQHMWRSVKNGKHYSVVEIVRQQGLHHWFRGDGVPAVKYVGWSGVEVRALWHFAMRFEPVSVRPVGPERGLM